MRYHSYKDGVDEAQRAIATFESMANRFEAAGIQLDPLEEEDGIFASASALLRSERDHLRLTHSFHLPIKGGHGNDPPRITFDVTFSRAPVGGSSICMEFVSGKWKIFAKEQAPIYRSALYEALLNKLGLTFGITRILSVESAYTCVGEIIHFYLAMERTASYVRATGS